MIKFQHACMTVYMHDQHSVPIHRNKIHKTYVAGTKKLLASANMGWRGAQTSQMHRVMAVDTSEGVANAAACGKLGYTEHVLRPHQQQRADSHQLNNYLAYIWLHTQALGMEFLLWGVRTYSFLDS